MKNFLNVLKTYKTHIICWSIFIFGETLVIGLASGGYGKLGNYITHYSLNILLFYFCANVLYPRIIRGNLNWIWKLPIAMALVFGLYLLLLSLCDYVLSTYSSWLVLDKSLMSKQYIFGTLWRTLQFMGFSGFYFLFKQHLKEIENHELAEKEKLQNLLLARDAEIKLSHATNSYLKAQINPHLLFNTLSLIYTDIIELAPKTAEAVMTLSDIMRYGINCEFTEATVKLGEEIEHVESLIKLYQIRFDNELNVIFEYDQEVKQLKFIPLILITIVENLFKHGNHLVPEQSSGINISYKAHQLIISSSNLITNRKSIQGYAKGLENIKHRLELVYGSKAKFTFGAHDGIFKLEIKLDYH